MQSLRLSRTVAMIFLAFLAAISGVATAAPASSASFPEAGIHGYGGVTQDACGASASRCASCVADPRVAVEGQVSSPRNSGCFTGFGVAAETADEAVAITRPYARPAGATTPAQRAAVQSRPCVDCGQIAERQVADHIEPLVQEYYRTGSIDLTRMRSVEAVQPEARHARLVRVPC